MKSLKERIVDASNKLNKLLDEYSVKYGKYKIGDYVYYYTEEDETFTGIGKIIDVRKSEYDKSDIESNFNLTYVINAFSAFYDSIDIRENKIIEKLSDEDVKNFKNLESRKLEAESKYTSSLSDLDSAIDEYIKNHFPKKSKK